MRPKFKQGDIVVTAIEPLSGLVMAGEVIYIRDRGHPAQLYEVNYIEWIARDLFPPSFCVLFHHESELKTYCPAGELWNLK